MKIIVQVMAFEKQALYNYENKSTSTSYTLPSHLTTIAGGGCCMRKREYDRKDRSIVDRKPEVMTFIFKVSIVHFMVGKGCKVWGSGVRKESFQ